LIIHGHKFFAKIRNFCRISLIFSENHLQIDKRRLKMKFHQLKSYNYEKE
jgi:hypothetical protein